MVIVKLWGGLGNQMFQYALYLAYKHKHVTVKLDKSFYDTYHDFNGYELEKIFAIQPDYSGALETSLLKAFSKLGSKLLGTPYKETTDMLCNYYEEVAEMKSGFLKGYWQSEKYFSDCTNIIRSAFAFSSPDDEKNKNTLAEMKNTNSVSVHIRRGDYLEQNRDWAIGPEYYKKAISEMQHRLESPVFFVFSDDIQWVKDNIDVPNPTYVTWNTKENSFRDMQLMSSCKHNIIANSSFSWWGAWLNENPGKIVLTPNRWFPFFEGTRDVIPSQWEKISF